MHLASKFLVACLENAEKGTADAFYEEIGARLKKKKKDYTLSEADLDHLLDTDRVLGGGGLGAARMTFRHESLRKRGKYHRQLTALAEAGLRLAALFHDLGHLPFSHDFEFALRVWAKVAEPSSELPAPMLEPLKELAAKSAPHEDIGHSLANLVFGALLSLAK